MRRLPIPVRVGHAGRVAAVPSALLKRTVKGGATLWRRRDPDNLLVCVLRMENLVPFEIRRLCDLRGRAHYLERPSYPRGELGGPVPTVHRPVLAGRHMRHTPRVRERVLPVSRFMKADLQDACERPSTHVDIAFSPAGPHPPDGRPRSRWVAYSEPDSKSSSGRAVSGMRQCYRIMPRTASAPRASVRPLEPRPHRTWALPSPAPPRPSRAILTKLTAGKAG